MCHFCHFDDIARWQKIIKLHNAVVNAKVLLENSSNNIVRSDADKLIIIDGLHDYIIVDKEGILLIYPKSKEQDIKAVVARLANM